MTLHACPHCGCLLTKARSGPDHRRFFSVVSKAFDHWPHDHEFQPSNAEHLRAYLLVRANHYNIASIPAPEGYAEHASIRSLFRVAVESAASALAGPSGYFDVRVSAAGVEVLTPKSINWSTVSQREFGPIRDTVEHIIETALKVDIQTLLREQAA